MLPVHRSVGLSCLLLFVFSAVAVECLAQAGSNGSNAAQARPDAETAAAVDIASDSSVSGEVTSAAARHYMKRYDWAIIVLYGLGMLGVGWYFSRRMTSREDYLLGGRNMRSTSVGLSLFATLFSTITYLGTPGEMIDKGPVFLWSMVSIPIAYVVVGYLLIPRFMRLQLTSAYEVLEARLGVGIRMFGSIIFLLTRMLWMALIIYITSEKIIVVMMDLDPSWTPWIAMGIGLITVAYTSMGGLRAVVFTDVVQSFILLFGAVLTISTITYWMGGVGAWWPREWSPNWDHQPIFSLDPTLRLTVVGSIVALTVWWICTAGSDQMAIQRYFATRDVKAARRMFLMTGLVNIVITSLLACVGFGLLAFFKANPQYLGPGMDLNTEKTADVIFPYYIIRFIPAGITGLVVAGLLAAAMSSLSSGINSSCSVLSVDFFDRFRRPGREQSEARQMARSKVISVAVGLFAVLLSSQMSKVTGNIMEVTVRTNHVFVAPLFALFVMALFVPFATTIGTAVGAVAGCGVAVLIAYWDLLTGPTMWGPIAQGLGSLGQCVGIEPGVPLSFQWISLVALVVNLAVALPLSYLTYRGQRPAIDELEQ